MVIILSSKTRWNQECHKRWFQWRYVNRLTLHFSRKAEIVPNGLPKMCPRLEPQHHFEVACCNGIADVAMARVSYIFGGVSHGGRRLRAPRQDKYNGLSVAEQYFQRRRAGEAGQAECYALSITNGPSQTYIVAANIGRHYVSSRRAARSTTSGPSRSLV